MNERLITELVELMKAHTLIGDGVRPCPGAKGPIDMEAWSRFQQEYRQRTEDISSRLNEAERLTVSKRFNEWFRDYLRT